MRYVISVCLTLALILAGCGKSSEVENTTKAAPTIEMNKETSDKLFVLPNYGDGAVTYQHPDFKKGMSRSEILDTFGTPKSKFKTKDKTYEIYGNVGLYYEDDTVEDVVYYANVPKDTAVKTMGEPDRETETNGMHEFSYKLKDSGDEETHLVLWSKDGKQIGPVTIEVIPGESKEDRDTATKENDSTDESESDKDNEDNKDKSPQNEDEVVEQFMESYIEDLVQYYNGESDAVLEEIESGSSAETTVKKNKESGDFKDQESIDVRLVKYTYVNSDYDVTIERDYKHAKSGGVKTTTVNYKLKKVGDNNFEVVSFEEQ